MKKSSQKKFDPTIQGIVTNPTFFDSRFLETSKWPPDNSILILILNSFLKT